MLAKETGQLRGQLDIHGRQRCRLPTLRYTYRTVADESTDQPALDFIVGHEGPYVSAGCRRTISDRRLRTVAHHLRACWFGPQL